VRPTRTRRKRSTEMSDLKVYIAGRYTTKHLLRKWRDRLEALGGVKVISTWLDEEDSIMDKEDVPRHEWKSIAMKDLQEVKECDVFLLDLDGQGGGGRYVEFGTAYALSKLSATVGVCLNCLFDPLATVHHNTWPEALAWVEEIRNA